MNNFIVFNTESQAKNYVKRQKSYYHNEGCGCCYSQMGYSIDYKTKLVMAHSSGSHIGEYYHNIVVIGRIK